MKYTYLNIRFKVSASSSSRGFALIATISVMVLLVMITIGMLSLSSVETRLANSELAQQEAKANARMAMMIAMGELQKTLGVDQAVTARASIVDSASAQQNVLGVWESWRWQPSLDGAPDYTEKSTKFKQWLISKRNHGESEDLGMIGADLSGEVGQDWQWLWSPNSKEALERTPKELYSSIGLKSELVSVDSGEYSGMYGWAVTDQSMAASLALNKKTEVAETVGARAASRVAPVRVRSDALSPRLAGLDAEQSSFSVSNAVLLAGKDNEVEVMGRTHDFTEMSLGVLSDVARGGLKVDLSNMFESSTQPSELLSEIKGEPVSDEIYFQGNGGPRWSRLRSYYKLYNRVESLEEEKPKVMLSDSDYTPFSSVEEYENFADSPDEVRLLPVISKIQMVFSLVSHETQIRSRRKFLDARGDPRGSDKYGVPMLTYDPVVTLHNPYDVEIEMPYMRVRIWDPPVVFRFKKNGVYVREDFEHGRFCGLSRFQLKQQSNPFSRKYFNLILSELGGSSDEPGSPIVLKPGEVKVFSPYIEKEWNWALETKHKYKPKAFFDYELDSRFGEVDNRTQYGPLGKMGVHCVPGWNTRAGLTTDHLGQENLRPPATVYPFEVGTYHGNSGWLAVKKTDTFTVEAKPGKAYLSRKNPDFMVDVLSGKDVSHEEDLLRRFEFKFKDVVQELSDDPENPVIERVFKVGDIFQGDTDDTAGGKTPFAILTMTAKTTVDELTSTKPWLYNSHVVEGGQQKSADVGIVHHSYDVNFKEVTSFTDFPGVEIDPDTKRGFYGASATANLGVSNVPVHRVPLGPCSSLGDLIHSNLVAGRALPRVTHPLGNSHSPAMVRSNRVAEKGGKVSFDHYYLDHSYLLNDSLWDGYYFSSVVDQKLNYTGEDRTRSEVLLGIHAGKSNPLNVRLVSARQTANVAQNVADVFKTDASASKGLAAEMMVQGMFNVNSDSVDAWRSMLMSLRDEAVQGWGKRSHGMEGRTGFPRMSLPLGGDSVVAGVQPVDVAGAVRWAGFRSLSDDQIKQLSESIVVEIRKRGHQDHAPFQTLGEFVNRRIGNEDTLHVLSGVLEQAIETSGINVYSADDSIAINTKLINSTDKKGIKNLSSLEGQSAEGSPVAISQGDLLGPLSSVVSVRGDTFKIRAYGDSRDRSGKVIARVWCEAVVQRLPNFIDPSDDPATPLNDLTSDLNKKFGRRFVVASFRWLSPNEI